MNRAPRGLGFFLASGDQDRGNGGRTAERVRAAGADWAALWIEAPDGRRPRLETLAEYASGLYAVGCEVWLWTFPDSDGTAPEDAATWARKALDATHARGLILDVEAAYKGAPEAARRLVASTLDALDERHGVGVTSFPYGHRTMPWSDLGVGFGQPQLYTSATTQPRIERAYREWGARHDVIVPLVGSYLGDAVRLRQDLQRVCLDVHGRPRCQGVGVWAWGTTSARERQITEECSRWW